MIAAAVLAVSAIAVTVLPIADARAEGVSANAESHVEQPGSPGCPAVHDELTCQLCRGLRLFAASGPSAPVLLELFTGAVRPTSAVEGAPAARVHSNTAPRAPPQRV